MARVTKRLHDQALYCLDANRLVQCLLTVALPSTANRHIGAASTWMEMDGQRWSWIGVTQSAPWL